MAVIEQERVPVRVKIAYGFGAIAYGIKDNGFTTFLLLFYNQVVGLPAATVGLVIGLALVFDAFIDPALGLASDRTRSRLGRRHPWLYLSALPIAGCWLLLWHPPIGSSQAALLGWLFMAAILTRAAIATNEVPSYALAPELTRDYHERTSVFAYRYVFGWLGGLAFLMLAFGWFLAPPRGSLTGPLALNGYGAYGTASAVVMAVVVLVSALGTQRFALTRATPPVERQTFRQLVSGLRQTLSNRAFLLLMAAGVLAYSAQGISFALSNYLLAFVWGFAPGQFLTYSVVLFGGVVVASLIAAPISRRLGKRRAASILWVGNAILLTLPYGLRLAGAFPTPGDPLLLPVYLGIVAATGACGVASFIITASMMSDVVEQSEEQTGRREEGLFFAGSLFVQKCSSGIGIFASGLILSAAAFPTGAKPGTVGVATLDRLTLTFALVYLLLGAVSAVLIARFPFGRAEHEARLARLAVASGERG